MHAYVLTDRLPLESRSCQGYGCFELLGFDVMMDYKLRPYLLEVNHTPSFTCDSPLDTEVKSSVLRATMEMVSFSKEERRILRPTGKPKRLTPEVRANLVAMRHTYELHHAERLGFEPIYPPRRNTFLARLSPEETADLDARYASYLAASTQLFSDMSLSGSRRQATNCSTAAAKQPFSVNAGAVKGLLADRYAAMHAAGGDMRAAFGSHGRKSGPSSSPARLHSSPARLQRGSPAVRHPSSPHVRATPLSARRPSSPARLPSSPALRPSASVARTTSPKRQPSPKRRASPKKRKPAAWEHPPAMKLNAAENASIQMAAIAAAKQAIAGIELRDCAPPEELY
jgi:hypothetical protein